MFHDILHRKTVFLDNKNIDFKVSKNGSLSKGLVHGFGQKFEIFPYFYFVKSKQTKFV